MKNDKDDSFYVLSDKEEVNSINEEDKPKKIDFIDCILFSKYKIIKKMNEGNFSCIYQAINDKGDNFCCKIEPINSKN